MDCLSQLRDVKSVIASVISDLFSQGSNMKYSKLGEELASQDSVNDLVVDMFEGETLKCDLVTTCDESSVGYEICTLDESMQSESTKGYKSCISECNSTVDVSSVDSGNSSVGSEDMSCKLVITYYFSFETEETDSEVVDNSESDNEISDIFMDKNNVKEESDEKECDNDMDDTFDSSFCCDNDMDLLEYSSVKNGSKNNLLDASFGLEVSDGTENMGLVDSDPFDSGNDSDTSTIPARDVHNLLMEDLEISDSSGEDVSESKYCGNPSTPSMRKGFIYYSSEVRLYQGELRYEDESCTEKKFKLARRLLRKVFPSQKYVVNA